METEEEEAVQIKPLADAITPLVQRQTAPAEESEEEPEEQEEEPIQTKQAGAQTAHIGTDLQAQIDSMKGGGQPLPHSTRAFFEPPFGRDFGGVRVHTGHRASETATAVEAKAFTLGQNIVFQGGQYSPDAKEGQKLLAHELTHTIQQGAVPPLEGPLRRKGPAARVALAAPHARPIGIQRSVQERGVSSPETVLMRIARVVKTHWLLPIPLQLWKLAHEFHPGEGKDDPRNAFVYTCKGGWIDMGHFFFVAAGAAQFPTRGYAWRRALQTEADQQREREKFEKMPLPEREKYFGRSWREAQEEEKMGKPEKANRRGIAWSAYTIEDLPSDKFGFDFGKSLWPAASIFLLMVGFFNQQGAVNARSDGKVLKRMMVETLGSEEPEKLPRQHYSTEPVKLESAIKLGCPPPVAPR